MAHRRRALDEVSLRAPCDSARPSSTGPGRPARDWIPERNTTVNSPVSAAAHRAAQPNLDAVVTDILEAPRYHDVDTDLSARYRLGLRF